MAIGLTMRLELVPMPVMGAAGFLADGPGDRPPAVGGVLGMLGLVRPPTTPPNPLAASGVRVPREALAGLEWSEGETRWRPPPLLLPRRAPLGEKIG